MDWNERRTAYGAKLKDPRWQQKRLRILERDEFTCRVCGSKERTLHVHHLAYPREDCDPWDSSVDLLVTLCEPCHEVEHNNHRDMVYALLDMLATARICTSIDLFYIIRKVGPAWRGLIDEHPDLSPDFIMATALGMVIQEWPDERAKYLKDGTYYADR